jgi:phytol kinase
MLTTWTTVAVLQAIFLMFLAAVSRAAAREALQPETSRKVLHTGAGLLTLVLPFAFRDLWPVALLAVMTAAALAVIRLLPAMRMRFGAAAYRVGRSSYGEFYFLLAVVALFWLAEGQSALLFTIPVLILTLADTAGALAGSRYGRCWYGSWHKTVEGSIAFAAIAFLCAHGPLLLWTSIGRAESFLIAATLALLVTLIEASAWRGRDNLLIPIGSYILLRCFLPLTLGTLVICFTAALVLVLVIASCVVYLRMGMPWMKSSRSSAIRST